MYKRCLSGKQIFPRKPQIVTLVVFLQGVIVEVDSSVYKVAKISSSERKKYTEMFHHLQDNTDFYAKVKGKCLVSWLNCVYVYLITLKEGVI